MLSLVQDHGDPVVHFQWNGHALIRLANLVLQHPGALAGRGQVLVVDDDLVDARVQRAHLGLRGGEGTIPLERAVLRTGPVHARGPQIDLHVRGERGIQDSAGPGDHGALVIPAEAREREGAAVPPLQLRQRHAQRDVARQLPEAPVAAKEHARGNRLMRGVLPDHFALPQPVPGEADRSLGGEALAQHDPPARDVLVAVGGAELGFAGAVLSQRARGVARHDTPLAGSGRLAAGGNERQQKKKGNPQPVPVHIPRVYTNYWDCFTISRRASQRPGSIGSQRVKPRRSSVAATAASRGTPRTRRVPTDPASKGPTPPGSRLTVATAEARMK